MENKNIAIIGILFFVTSIMTGIMAGNYYSDLRSDELIEELQAVNQELVLSNLELDKIITETVLDNFARFDSEDEDFVVYRKSDLMTLVKKVSELNTERIYYQDALENTIEYYQNRRKRGGSVIVTIPSGLY